MALKTCTKRTLDGHWAQCGYAPSYLTETVNINNVTFGRDTSDCRRAILTYSISTNSHYTQINWGNPNGTFRQGAQLSSNINSNTGYNNHTRGNRVCTEAGKNYSYSGNLTCKIDSGSGDPVVTDRSDNGAGAEYSYMATCTWPRTVAYKITPPTGLTCSWPSAVGGNVSASITNWSANTHIGGAPTTYPNAKYWNWALDLLNKDGGMVAHYAANLGENKSVTFPGNSFYTASALPGSAQANSTKYNFVKNGAYKLRVVVNNSFNQQQSATSGLLYTNPPTPKVKINSCVYDPNTKLCKLTFTYSKEKDGGGLGERLRYDIYDVRTGVSLSGKDNVTIGTVTDGRAMSGTITVTGIPTATNIGVRVELTTSNDSYTNVRESAYDTIYAPVADAAFISFDWDELRRTCVITATAPGAKQTRLSAGYSPNNYNVATKVTPGETGTVTVKDLNHGTGQILYLEAMPEAADSHKYKDEVAKISIPIPNPILGIKTYPCGSGRDSEYIVDIIEHKKNNACTPRWQNGDRVVKKNPC